MRLSHSAVEMYKSCSYKYKLHYIERLRSRRQSSALVFGVAFDEALNTLLLSKDEAFIKAWGDCTSVVVAKKIFTERWMPYKDSSLVDYYKSDPDWEGMYHKGLGMIDAYATEILPRIKKVISVQDKIMLHGHDEHGNETEDSITGIIDFIADVVMDDGRVVRAIIDNKSSSKPYTKNAVSVKEQTALYAMAHPDIEYVAFAVVCKPAPHRTQLLIGTPPDSLKETVIDNFTSACHNINNGVFEQNKKSCFSFGTLCQFASHCNGRNFSEDIYKVEESDKKSV